MKKTKIVICGGHLSPALALVESLIKDKSFDLHFIGRIYQLEGDKSISLEYKTISKLGIPFYSLTNSRLQRSITCHTFKSLLKFPQVLWQSFRYIRQIKPDLVISFGGFIALPVSVIAWLLHIPLMTHEQTHVMGLSNKIISKFARVTCLSYKDTQNLNNNIPCITIGNLVRKSIYIPYNKSKYNFGNKNLPLIYITGGSTGANAINQLVMPILKDLINRFRILHQAGGANEKKDLRKLLKLCDSSPQHVKENYQAIENIDPNDMGNVYNDASIIIGRAGANTTFEIACRGIPAILIPLPWSADHEQEINAQYLYKKGLVEIIPQYDSTPKKLMKEIFLMFKDLSKYKLKGEELKKQIPLNGVEEMVKLIKLILNNEKISSSSKLYL